MGSFPTSYKNHYVLVIVDYISKWAEVLTTLTKDAKMVVKFFKRKIFTHFGTLRTIISNSGSHFYNYLIERILKKYNMTHKVITPSHPQTNG